MKAGDKNAYYCDLCKQYTITIDVDEGVTPMFLGCRATEGCKGRATSMMYPAEPWPDSVPTEPMFEWFKPVLTAGQLKRHRREFDPFVDHVQRGGLDLRPVST